MFIQLLKHNDFPWGDKLKKWAINPAKVAVVIEYDEDTCSIDMGDGYYNRVDMPYGDFMKLLMKTLNDPTSY